MLAAPLRGSARSVGRLDFARLVGGHDRLQPLHQALDLLERQQTDALAGSQLGAAFDRRDALALAPLADYHLRCVAALQLSNDQIDRDLASPRENFAGPRSWPLSRRSLRLCPKMPGTRRCLSTPPSFTRTSTPRAPKKSRAESARVLARRTEHQDLHPDRCPRAADPRLLDRRPSPRCHAGAVHARGALHRRLGGGQGPRCQRAAEAASRRTFASP